MSFAIADPTLGLFDRLRLSRSARRAWRTCGELRFDAEGYLLDNQVAELAAKARQALLVEMSGIRVSRTHRRLLALWAEYRQAERKLDALTAEWDAALSQARRRSAEELEEEALAQSRARSRSRKIDGRYAAEAASLEGRLSAIEQEAERDCDLRGYEAHRIEVQQKLRACAVRHHWWPSVYYGKQLARFAGHQGQVPKIAFTRRGRAAA